MFPISPLCWGFYHKCILYFEKVFIFIYWKDHVILFLSFIPYINGSPSEELTFYLLSLPVLVMHGTGHQGWPRSLQNFPKVGATPDYWEMPKFSVNRTLNMDLATFVVPCPQMLPKCLESWNWGRNCQSGSKLTISPWRLIVRTSGSLFGVTLHALQIWIIIIMRITKICRASITVPVLKYVIFQETFIPPSSR